MARIRQSEVSFGSGLGDELDQIRTQDDYELDEVSRISTATPSLYQETDYHPERHLLAAKVQRSLGSPDESGRRAPRSATSYHKGGILIEVKGVYDAQKSAAVGFWRSIRIFITRSGRLEIEDPTPEATATSGFRYRWRLYGWRFGVFLAASAVTVCLLVELSMLIAAVIIDKRNGRSGELYVGACNTVDHLNVGLAVVLNVVATVLMATSNYVMQCLSAPSRKDIDRTHAAGSYLNIGASSVHNMLYNPSRKSVLWLSLVLTSIPIHLLFNSAFYGALQANNYGVLVASTGWERTHSLAALTVTYNSSTGHDSVLMFVQHMSFLSSHSLLDHLDKDTCFQRYSTQLPSAISNVVIVTKQTTGNYGLIPSSKPSVDPAGIMKPFSSYQLPDGVGLSFTPFSGNAIPMLDPNYTWTSGILPQNSSGGLYPWVKDGSTIRGVFTALDYHYWTTIDAFNYNFNDSRMLQAGTWSPTSWMCKRDEVLAGQMCTSGSNPDRPEPWLITPRGFEVDHCLSQSAEEQCSLQYSWIILVIVICCDIAKIVAMLLTLFVVPDPPLATLGDAVSSFLETPDPHTRGCCLLQQDEAHRITHGPISWWRFWKIRHKNPYGHANQDLAERMDPKTATWNPTITRWASAPSTNRWILFGVLYTALFGSSFVVLWLGIRKLTHLGITDPLNRGFGSIDPNALFTNPSAFVTQLSGSNTSTIVETQSQNTNSALFSSVVFANIPQLLFSSLYFLYNGLFTSMLTAAEWTQFASVRKALRVSTPRRGQRSTYWLQLPWRYSLPVLSISIAVHWLVSRSLFLVRISVFSWAPQPQDGTHLNLGVKVTDQHLEDRDIYACGFSPLAIVLVIIVVFLSLIVVLIVSRRKFAAAIPMCGTNSLAISAACHYVKGGDPDVTRQLLMWGVTRPAGPDFPGHCSLSDGHVEKPISGMVYL